MLREPAAPGGRLLLWQQARQWPLPLRSFLLSKCLPHRRGDSVHRCAGRGFLDESLMAIKVLRCYFVRQCQAAFGTT